jgi:hypothetical protein
MNEYDTINSVTALATLDPEIAQVIIPASRKT